MAKKKDTYPTQEQIDDFSAWVDDLSNPHLQSAISNELIEILDNLPTFAKRWTVQDLVSVIQDNHI